MNRSTREAHKINRLDILYEIRDNQYRSRDAQRDYDPDSVNDRIYELERLQAERLEKQWEDDQEEMERQEMKMLLIHARQLFPHLEESTRMNILRDLSPLMSDFI